MSNNLSVKEQCARQEQCKENNLDLYLKDVFDKECKINVASVEIECIKTGVERIVTGIVNAVLEDEDYQRDMKSFERDADKRGREVKHGPNDIVKVGSFYEQTKNKFPDEFDFIFVLGCIERQLYDKNTHYSLKFKFADVLCDIRDQKLSVEFSDPHILHEARVLLDVDRFPNFINGPAFCVPFIYEYLDTKVSIFADLVLAWKVEDISITEHAIKFCELEPFRKEILSTGSFLLMENSTVSFTKTEVNFMRNVLSQTHVRCYRILKYLINGHGDGEELKDYLNHEKESISSYNLKTLMIHHHYACANPDESTTANCMLQVLTEMCKHETMETFPSICFNFRRTKKLCLTNHLKGLMKVLTEMKGSDAVYNYQDCRFEQSVSKQYIDDNKLNTKQHMSLDSE